MSQLASESSITKTIKVTEHQGDFLNYLGNLIHNNKMYVRNLNNKSIVLRQNVPYERKFFTISEISIEISIMTLQGPA